MTVEVSATCCQAGAEQDLQSQNVQRIFAPPENRNSRGGSLLRSLRAILSQLARGYGKRACNHEVQSVPNVAHETPVTCWKVRSQVRDVAYSRASDQKRSSPKRST